MDPVTTQHTDGVTPTLPVTPVGSSIDNRTLELQRQNAELEARLRAAEEKEKAAKLAAMQPDERMRTQMEDFQRQLAERDQRAARQQQEFMNAIRARDLVAYRAVVLSKFGDQIIADMVQGNSEAEIDEAADAAVRAYKDIYGKAEQAVQAKLAAQAPQQTQAPQYVPVPVVAAPVQSPYYPAPPPPGYAWPTVPNAASVAEADAGQMDVKTMTSEEAVRSGRYGGELRQQLLQQARRMPPGGAVGYQPRYQPGQQPMPPQYQPMPGGVMQPQGFPTGPVQNPNYQQQQMQQFQQAPQQQQMAVPPQMPYLAPQMVQPGPQTYVPPGPGGQLSGLDHNQAMAAIARTHQGANPAMSANPGAADALRTAQQFGNANGITPSAAFNARFANSPPIQPVQA